MDERYDVVVIGEGIAGLSATLATREQGATVCLCEKLPTTGGNARYSASMFLGAHNHSP
ncbi:MAG: FAD-dependent oxidoreductase [Stellaceae bacterium]